MGSTIYDILDELYFSATDERDKGDKFERLMASYLRTDLTWADRFSDVWMWTEWPDRHGKPDTGIDLVAQERESGELVAIQCKFYDPQRTLQKQDIDSFFTASGKAPFARRLIFSTTDKWGKNAEDALEGQTIPVNRVGLADLEQSSIDWSQFSIATPEVMEYRDKKRLRPHQVAALEKVRAGFEARDRGKLIMACGTGKTFTSLRIAEDLVKPGGTVLFLVPSISLLSQSLREWTIEAEVPLRPFAVCSDTKVGKRSHASPSEDMAVHDLALPATTDARKLHGRLSDTAAGEDKLTVVFSTYQSIAVVAEAQRMGLAEFDLVICDEAHRTTGVTLAGEDESAFVRVHDQSFLAAKRRLYMTATPRIYDDNSRTQATQASAVVASMDDEGTYGPEFHRLGFGEAVSRGLLTDYKVLVLAVDEESVSRTFQSQLADENSELRLDDVAKIVGCWNGLAKRGRGESGFSGDDAPMGRAVAFARSIRDSKRFAETFESIVAHYTASHDESLPDEDSEQRLQPLLKCEVEHVDGTYNVLRRDERLSWLKAPTDPDVCRVLSNARCLSEGVDVPALDAVMFLNPRNSVVDVVQSVGRVMRKSPGKQYGYVILPIGIPSDLTPEQALGDNQKYKVVWQVLQALRAHDERFNAMVNQIELNRARNDRLQVIGVGGFSDDTEDGSSTARPVQTTMQFPYIGQWREAIYAKIVAKVGSRRYWEDWAKDVSVIAERHTTRIKALLADPSLQVQGQFNRFLEGLRANLNESISRDDAIDMLSQHLITKPVFDALFEGYSFTEHNPVSRVMQGMLDALEGQNLAAETESLEGFYDSVRLRAEGIDNAEGKQKIITELYEKFFRLAFPKAADSLGIVYTPVQIVDFILRSVEHLLGTEFDASLSDEGVHVLDPFTGTGTFIVRLLESGLIRPDDLARKYASEIHANEILLLAYYIAAINIEATYHGLLVEAEKPATDEAYVPFDGIVLADTFQMTEHGDKLDTVVFPANNERAARQLELDLRVIIANPPYSVGQGSGNDNNANLKYPTLDRAIEHTYAARSTATNKNSLYDSYIRAIRWASDRIKDAGIIGFVTNGGFIDANTADGLRKTLVDEFASIYVFNLRGNQRTAGELSRREGGKIFGAGSRNTVAITLLVKKPSHAGPATIHYRDIGDYLSREDKLDIVAESDLALIDWQTVTPNAAGDWINQRGDTFVKFTPIGDKSDPTAIFRVYSGGLKSNRDAWVYNSSRAALERHVASMIVTFNAEVARFNEHHNGLDTASRKKALAAFVDRDSSKISWGSTLEADLLASRNQTLSTSHFGVAMYRPFTRQHVYYDARLNERRYQLPRIFPTPNHPNHGFYVVGRGSDKPFSTLATDCLPDLAFWGSSQGQYFARWTYEALGAEATGQETFDLTEDIIDGYRRIDNIPDRAVADFRVIYGATVTADDIYFYVYGLLHSPDYRAEFAADLRKSLPRIPKVPTEDFWTFSRAGRALSDLHVGYESVPPHPLTITGEPGSAVAGQALFDWYRVEKMRHPKTGRSEDTSTVVYNSRITVSGIPEETHDYLLGSRSALAWVMERYQVKKDKASGIVNDPNDWSREVGDPRYILDLLGRVVAVSVHTVHIVESLPPLRIQPLD